MFILNHHHFIWFTVNTENLIFSSSPLSFTDNKWASNLQNDFWPAGPNLYDKWSVWCESSALQMIHRENIRTFPRFGLAGPDWQRAGCEQAGEDIILNAGVHTWWCKELSRMKILWCYDYIMFLALKYKMSTLMRLSTSIICFLLSLIYILLQNILRNIAFIWSDHDSKIIFIS